MLVAQHCECSKCHGIVQFQWLILWLTFRKRSRLVTKRQVLSDSTSMRNSEESDSGRERSTVGRGRGKEWGVFNGDRVSLVGDVNTLEIYHATPCMYLTQRNCTLKSG